MIGKPRLIDPSVIVRKAYRKTLEIRNKQLTIEVEDALYAPMGEGEEPRLLDEPLVTQMIRGIAAAVTHNASPYNPVPERIVISRGAPAGDADGSDGGEVSGHFAEGMDAKAQPASPVSHQVSTPGLWSACTPRWTLNEVSLSQEARSHIEAALVMIRHREKLFGEWGLEESHFDGRAIVLNFYGPPGTGKSMTAEALAGTLGRQVLLVNYAELESKFVGETPKNIKSVFAAASGAGAVLVFDEADSFLGKRLTHVQQSSDYGVNISRSVMLLELERFDGVVVFTTNLLQNYDDAFRRRILAQVAFRYPDESERTAIWERHLPRRLPLGGEVNPAVLAAAFDHMTGADIKDMVLYASALCLKEGGQAVEMHHFRLAADYVASRYVQEEGGPDPS
ncbi:MAG: ATpase [Paenibacillaceae bacterium]|nr:ATpase [Paenibacillaceae bacterium]